MLLTVQTRLLPDDQQANQLKATMQAFNAACNYASQVAFATKTFSQTKLHKACYYTIRQQFGLSAQMAVRAIGKVVESYKAEKRRQHTFKPLGAMPHDDRTFTIKSLDEVSILTLQGRITAPLALGTCQKGTIMGRRIRGQADLIYRDGMFFLLIVVELPDPPKPETDDWLGVDLGIVNIAADSDGETFSGKHVNNARCCYERIRRKLQKKGTKSARRLLKKRRRKEHRFATDVNHCISKKLVLKAKDTGRGIAIEDLKGIRDRTTVRKAQRRRQHSWGFHQLRCFIDYKCDMYGVDLRVVDPHNTSRTCPACGHVARENRRSRDTFCCVSCGFAGPADTIAAENIRRAAVNQPYAAVA